MNHKEERSGELFPLTRIQERSTWRQWCLLWTRFCFHCCASHNIPRPYSFHIPYFSFIPLLQYTTHSRPVLGLFIYFSIFFFYPSSTLLYVRSLLSSPSSCLCFFPTRLFSLPMYFLLLYAVVQSIRGQTHAWYSERCAVRWQCHCEVSVIDSSHAAVMWRSYALWQGAGVCAVIYPTSGNEMQTLKQVALSVPVPAWFSFW